VDTKATLDKAGADKSSYANGVELAKQMIFPAIFNKGATIFMNAGQLKDEAAAATQYKTSLDLLTKAREINPEDRLPNYMLGYAQLMTKDTVAATKSWEKTLEYYAKYKAADAKAKKDSNMINVYLNLADVYMNKEKNTQKALDMLAAGKKEFPNHPDIEKNELSVYQRDPSFLSTAITKFEENLQKNPGDTQVRLAYASLLESASKKEQAIDQYKMVLKADPNNFIANANMGAFYVNTAAAISQQLKDSKDDNAYEGFTKGIADNFKLAYPYIKKAQELKPKEVEWIEQMIQITSFLMADPEMEKEMNKYYEMKKALQK
jgi:tetratricopeptide (TPR) repeat protein